MTSSFRLLLCIWTVHKAAMMLGAMGNWLEGAYLPAASSSAIMGGRQQLT